ncbi:MAG: hypothetical protein ORN49_08890 [Rhodobacteraceae bacterium]|nr:hypothetical protein [Paracoccaceae bacterium]
MREGFSVTMQTVFDPTKPPCAALTMVYQDYEFLRRWVDYYGRQLGDLRHLYILSHGGDPEHARIGAGANVINLPRDPSMFRLDRRRWSLISQFASGLLRYFNWVIAGDVDEVVIVDPDVAPGLLPYLMGMGGPDMPKSICPFGVELIHNPEVEPEPLDPALPILSRRRVFRANANYSKPSILRRETHFTVGGHANMHKPRYLDPHLYLIHMRFFDYDTTVARLSQRQEMRATMDGEGATASSGYAWSKDLETFKKLASGKPVREDAVLSEFRAKMIDGQTELHDGKVIFWGGGRSKELYRLPERFSNLF